MKIALVHDNFTQIGGAERVAEALYQVLPDATVFSTVATPRGTPSAFAATDIQTSWMRRLPGIDRHYRHYAPLSALAVGGLDLTGYDLVVSSSSGFAKGVRVDKNATHICYCHTPTPLVWRKDDYPAREEFSPGQRWLRPLMISNLRRWDQRAARQPDQYVVNSHGIAKRVWNAYGRRAVVIPPPVNVHRFKVVSEPDDYYLILSRLASHFQLNIAIEACNHLKRRLVIIGDGPDRARLQKIAGPTIEFLGNRPDDVITAYVERCRGLISPSGEDFGMTPLFASAAGRPVIAFSEGGALETVVEGVTGLFFSEPTAACLAEAIEKLENHNWNSRVIRRHAEGFDFKVFEARFTQLLSSIVPESISASPRLQSAVAVA